jgi:hypothetical protein
MAQSGHSFVEECVFCSDPPPGVTLMEYQGAKEI